MEGQNLSGINKSVHSYSVPPSASPVLLLAHTWYEIPLNTASLWIEALEFVGGEGDNNLGSRINRTGREGT